MNGLIKKYKKIQQLGNSTLESFRVLIRFRKLRSRNGVRIFAHSSFKIKGGENIKADNLWLGLHYRGYETSKDTALLNIKGKLIAKGFVVIGKGCRLDISKEGKVQIGDGSYINSNSKLIISKGLEIGENCAVSWDCQFLDNDFHEITIEGETKVTAKPIKIGDHVWIGSGAKIYKGVNIPNNCVVAADSSVKSVFTEENCLIGGNPAKIIKRNVSWK